MIIWALQTKKARLSTFFQHPKLIGYVIAKWAKKSELEENLGLKCKLDFENRYFPKEVHRKIFLINMYFMFCIITLTSFSD